MDSTYHQEVGRDVCFSAGNKKPLLVRGEVLVVVERDYLKHIKN